MGGAAAVVAQPADLSAAIEALIPAT